MEATDVTPAKKAASLKRTPKVEPGQLKGPVHFVGVGGIGMSALAELLLADGFKVSGSDRQAGEVSLRLANLGARISIGHQASNVDNAAIVVVSTAIGEENPELIAARANQTPVWHRSDMLHYLASSAKTIAITGTHGKTTTTGMVAQILLDAGADPKIVLGGVFERIGCNAHAGKGEFFVAESDESDRTHAGIKSFIGVITNIEEDHMENYPGGIEDILANMVAFSKGASFATIICTDDPGCRKIAEELSGRIITYGFSDTSPQADYTGQCLGRQKMKVLCKGRTLGEVTLGVPGRHNKINALAAIAVACEIGLEWPVIARALSDFNGVDRRFQKIGRVDGIEVIDDYAHHPTEVKATLQTAREYSAYSCSSSNAYTPAKPGAGGRVVAVFQPHQPGRLKDLWNEFLEAFGQADLVLVTDVYIARGKPVAGITAKEFVAALQHRNAHCIAGATDGLAARIVPYLKPGDLVLTIGAGDITRVGPDIVRLLESGKADGEL